MFLRAMRLKCGTPPGSWTPPAHNLSMRPLQTYCPKDLKERIPNETLKPKRRRPAHDLNSRHGALRPGGLDDVPVTVRDVVQPELPLNDPGPLRRRSRPPCRRELYHQPRNRLSRHRNFGPD